MKRESANPEPDPVAAAWARTSEAELQSVDLASLASSVSTAHREDQLRLVMLNVREFLPPLLLAGLIGLNLSDSVRPAALIVAIVLAVSVTIFLVGSSWRHHREDRRWGESIRDQIAQRSAQLKHRVWIYQNLGWWYFLPIAAAMALFVWGVGDIPFGEGVLIYAVMMAILAIVVWIYRVSGRNRYEDESRRIESILHEFDRAS